MSLTPSTEANQDHATPWANTTHPRRGGWPALAIVLTGAFMALLDTTVVTVALPSIATGLGASHAAVEWVVSGYALAYGLVLIPAGRAGDRFGHKGMFIVGLAVFTTASVVCGLANTETQIVIARAIQGLGAGLFYPSISAMIQLSSSGPARSKAFGALGATIGASIALGPVLCGLIITLAGAQTGWRWVFAVNLIVGAVALPLAALRLPPSPSKAPRSFDPLGLGLLGLGLLALLVPLIQGQDAGWPAWTYVSFACSVVVFAVLARWEIRAERRGGDPLLKPTLMRQPSFAAGSIFAVAYFAGFTSVFFTLSILWQAGLSRSAMATGLVALPFSIGSFVTAAASGRLSARWGRRVLLVGCVLVLVGVGSSAILVHLLGAGVSAWHLLVPLLVAGLGSGMVIAPNQDFVLAHVPHAEAGTAGAILGTAQRIGSAIGLAVVGTALFNSLPARPDASAYADAAQVALLVNSFFVLVALLLIFALPHTTVAVAPDSVEP